MSKIYVIAGNHVQADIWIRGNLQKRAAADEVAMLSDYCVVSNIHSIHGVRNPRGVFIGTWRERHNIKEILYTLFNASTEKRTRELLLRLDKTV